MKRDLFQILFNSGYDLLRREGNTIYFENRFTGTIVRLRGQEITCVWSQYQFYAYFAHNTVLKKELTSLQGIMYRLKMKYAQTLVIYVQNRTKNANGFCAGLG